MSSIIRQHPDQTSEHVNPARTLGVFGMVAYVLSAAAPFTVFAGVITVALAVTGNTGLALAFIVIGLVLALFCVGFNAMSRRISNAGAFYAYAAQGLGRPVGVATGLIAALAYMLLQVGLYGSFGPAVAPMLNSLFATNWPWPIWSLVAWALVAFLGFQRVDRTSRLLLLLMGVEVLMVLAFSVGNLAHPAGEIITFEAFDPTTLFVPGVGALFVIAITGFVGFEGTAIYSESARNPRRDVPRATLLSLFVIAAIYSISSWGLVVTIGPDQVAGVIGANPIEAVFALAEVNLGPVWASVGQALLTTSIFAAMVSFHNAVCWYMFALGREGVVPKFFAATSRANTPKWGSVFQSGVGLIVILVFAIANLDPVLQLFFWGGTTGGFGVLVLLAITSVAVVGYHIRKRQENVWRGLIAPFIAGALILVVLVLAIANFDVLLGVPSDDPIRWILPSMFPAIAVLGLVWAFVLRRTRPGTYSSIGLGANSQTGRSSNLQALLADDDTEGNGER